MKKLIAILITTVITLNIWGAKAYPEPITITQKDGKMLTYRLHGDEHFNYVTTTDGVLLYQQDMDFYIAVIDEYGKMSSSGVLAHNAGQRTAEEISLIGKQDKEKFFATADVIVAKSRSMKKTTMPEGGTTLFPHIGSPKALIILADFADQKFKHDDETTIAIFDHYLNSTEPFDPETEIDPTLCSNYGSVFKYFSDMSGGLFTPQFEIAALVHLEENMKVYGNTNGSGTDNISKFIKDVCNLADGPVDFSKYDANEDHKVDLLYIIYAGYGQSTGGGLDTIWPKSGPTDGTTTFGMYDETYICRYGVNPELNFSPDVTYYLFGDNPQINGIGLFCHEFSHCMGLPDVYPTSYDGQVGGYHAMELWDIMDGGEYCGLIKKVYNNNNKTYTLQGGYYPTAYTAWEREYMGWMDEMPVLKAENSGQLIELVNIDDGGQAYKIFPDDNEIGNVDEDGNEEYVFIQNIQSYGWNTSLGELGHGMLVTYICYKEEAFKLGGEMNNVKDYPRMTFVPADNIYISSYHASDKPGAAQYTLDDYRASHGGDPFPGTSDVHELRSIPMIWGGYDMEKPLLNIQEEEDGVVTFYFLSEPPKITTDIDEIDIASSTNETRIYTLDGRFVGNSTRGLAKGVYIINGKKTVIR